MYKGKHTASLKTRLSVQYMELVFNILTAPRPLKYHPYVTSWQPCLSNEIKQCVICIVLSYQYL